MRRGREFIGIFVFILLSIFGLTGCERRVWVTRSPEEIKALNEEIKPLPDSMLVIPEFDGKHAIPVIRFACDHVMESWEYIIYNNGDVFKEKRNIGNTSKIDMQTFISELNKKGLFNVTTNGIYYKLAGPRNMNIVDLLSPQPPRPIVPAPVIDGGTFTIQVNTHNMDYYLSFYAIDYYVDEFPVCQDIQILNESIKYLYSIFRINGSN